MTWNSEDPRWHIQSMSDILIRTDTHRYIPATAYSEYGYWIRMHATPLSFEHISAQDPWPEGWVWVRLPSLPEGY